jgi:hypothetical protein
VVIVLKSGSLNLLEPSGPVKACNGFALPLPLTIYYDDKDDNNYYNNHTVIISVGNTGLYLIENCQTTQESRLLRDHYNGEWETKLDRIVRRLVLWPSLFS